MLACPNGYVTDKKNVHTQCAGRCSKVLTSAFTGYVCDQGSLNIGLSSWRHAGTLGISLLKNTKTYQGSFNIALTF